MFCSIAFSTLVGCRLGGTNALGRLTQRIIEQVAIARRGGGLRMAEKLADDRERQAGAGQDRRIGVSQIVNSHIWKARRLADFAPLVIQAPQGAIWMLARENIGAGRGLPQLGQ